MLIGFILAHALQGFSCTNLSGLPKIDENIEKLSKKILICDLDQAVDEILKPNSDLYLDGTKLADHISYKLKNRPDKIDLEADNIYFLTSSLFKGEPVDYETAEQDKSQMLTWINKQKLGSITMDQFFLKATEVTKGNIENALILAWNTTLHGNDKKGIDRNIQNQTLKLQDITGELAYYDGGYHQVAEENEDGINLTHKLFMRGNNFSAWYHFWGTALHSYVRETSSLKWRIATEKLVYLEENIMFDDFVDPLKRRNIDLAGVSFGKKLYENLHTKDLKLKSPPEYLYENEEIYGDKWRLKKGERTSDFNHSLNKEYIDEMNISQMSQILLIEKLLAKETWNEDETCYYYKILINLEAKPKAYLNEKIKNKLINGSRLDLTHKLLLKD